MLCFFCSNRRILGQYALPICVVDPVRGSVWADFNLTLINAATLKATENFNQGTITLYIMVMN